MKIRTKIRGTNIAITIMVIVLFSMMSNANAQDGEKLFQQCAACHTIGKGKLLGPDLLDISKKRDAVWLKSFIKSSQSMIKAGDPDAVALFEEFNNLPMMDFNFSDPEMEAVIKYIDSFSSPDSEGGEVTDAVSDSVAAAEAAEYLASIDTEKNRLQGQQLFEGKRKFKNGGAACVSCHHVNTTDAVQGGLLAADLTQSFTKTGGFAGIKAMIEFPPFPAMKDAYQKAALTEEESMKIQVFLMHADKSDRQGETAVSDLIKQGIKGTLVLLVVIALVWFKRKKRSVNYQIIERQRRFG